MSSIAMEVRKRDEQVFLDAYRHFIKLGHYDPKTCYTEVHEKDNHVVFEFILKNDDDYRDVNEVMYCIQYLYFDKYDKPILRHLIDDEGYFLCEGDGEYDFDEMCAFERNSIVMPRTNEDDGLHFEFHLCDLYTSIDEYAKHIKETR